MSDQAPRLTVVCAWCPGLNPARPPELTSHGICAKCFARVTESEPPPDVPMAPSRDDDVDDDPPTGHPVDFHE